MSSIQLLFLGSPAIELAFCASHDSLCIIMFKFTKNCTALLNLSLICLTTLFAAGCGSIESEEQQNRPFASTIIETRALGTVTANAKYVFEKNGFTLVDESAEALHFTKPGSKSDKFTYASPFSKGVTIEPEILIEKKPEGHIALTCSVYMREHSRNPGLDTNWKLTMSNQSTYQGLLDEIKKRTEGKK